MDPADNKYAGSVDPDSYGQQPNTIAESVARSTRRQGTTTGLSTRSSNAKPKGQPKLKLKLSEKATAAMASGNSFLGPYDRELDSDDEDLAFEEQFILRMPPGEDCDKIRKLVQNREASNDIWFKFKGMHVSPSCEKIRFLTYWIRFLQSCIPCRE
jgi:transcription initiation factor TFIID subunit 7